MRTCSVAFAIAASIGAASVSHARTASLVVDGVCPDTALVEQLLAQLLTTVTLVDTAADTRVYVHDLGERYSIDVGASASAFSDPLRQCEERAKNVAIVAAIALEPINIFHRKTARVWTRFAANLAIAGDLVLGAQSSPTHALVGGGASLRGYLGTRYIGAVLGVAARRTTNLVSTIPSDRSSGAPGQVQVIRVPFDLSLRGILPIGRSQLWLDIGAVASIDVSRGVNLMSTTAATTRSFGVHAGAGWSFMTRRVAPYIAITVDAFPAPNVFTAAPLGAVATDANVLIALAFGLMLRLL